MKFILATGNMNKVREMRSLLSALGIEVLTQKEAGIDIEPEETGCTFAENAFIKADAVCRLAGIPAIADDSGLIVHALGGAPGVRSKRHGGGELDDSGRCAYLLSEMENINQRSAKFVSSIVCVFPNGDMVSAEGECIGEILYTPRGDGGFGYDPVFLVSELDKSMAELTLDEKNEISHRGAALNAFARKLSDYLKGNNI